MEKNLFEPSSIRLKSHEETSLNPNKMFLTGEMQKSDVVREQLLSLQASGFNNLIDKGNISPEYVEDYALYNNEIVENERTVGIVIGSDRMLKSLAAHISNDELQQITVVSNRIFLDHANVTHIGIQNHLAEQPEHSEIIRLSSLRDKPEMAEVKVRQAETVIIDIAAIRRGDNLGCLQSMTSGLTIEEICLLAKYIGAATALRNVYIVGLDVNADKWGMMAQNTALIIWYLLDGFTIRLTEMLDPEDISKYAILPSNLEQEITFKRHQRTGRWWIETYSEHFETYVSMACSPHDYELACADVLSDRLLEVLAKA